jgi:hypothetical protein
VGEQAENVIDGESGTPDDRLPHHDLWVESDAFQELLIGNTRSSG